MGLSAGEQPVLASDHEGAACALSIGGGRRAGIDAARPPMPGLAERRLREVTPVVAVRGAAIGPRLASGRAATTTRCGES